MADPKPSPRAVMREAMAACLRRISPDAGYRTDLGEQVDLEPAPVLAEDERAFITVVWSRQARPQAPAVQRTHRETVFDVIAKVPADLDEAQQALDDAVADIEQAMDDQAFRYPNGYQAPQYRSAEPLTAGFGAGWIGVVVSYVSNIPIK